MRRPATLLALLLMLVFALGATTSCVVVPRKGKSRHGVKNGKHLHRHCHYRGKKHKKKCHKHWHSHPHH